MNPFKFAPTLLLLSNSCFQFANSLPALVDWILNSPTDSDYSDPTNSSSTSLSSDMNSLACLFNQYRAQFNAPPLVVSIPICAMSQKQADAQATENQVSHVGVNGETFQQRAQSAPVKVLAEICTGGRDVKEAYEVWSRSEPHMVHVRDPSFLMVGMARQGEYWTADFSPVKSADSVTPQC